MKLTEKQQWSLEGINLWKHAKEGSRSAQHKVAESIASGEFPTQIAPQVRRQLKAVFETVPTLSDAFTSRKTVLAINVDEQYNIYGFGDQSNIEGTNMGDTFVNGGLPSLGPRESYPEIGLTASGKTLRAGKLGEAFAIDWESIVRLNGTNVRIIDEAVNAFGRHAGNAIDIDVAKRFVTAAGYNTGTTGSTAGVLPAGGQLTSANGWTGTPNPDLSNPINLQNAVQFALQKSITVAATGTTQLIPVSYSKYALVVPFAYGP